VLDANKQVIYARDQRGAVIARQLVGVSKENELVVCFQVYPASIRAGVMSLFRDNDQAQALGLPLYRRSQECAFRPGRSAQQAVARAQQHIAEGFTLVCGSGSGLIGVAGGAGDCSPYADHECLRHRIADAAAAGTRARLGI